LGLLGVLLQAARVVLNNATSPAARERSKSWFKSKYITGPIPSLFRLKT
jgi:hypothetical protein